MRNTPNLGEAQGASARRLPSWWLTSALAVPALAFLAACQQDTSSPAPTVEATADPPTAMRRIERTYVVRPGDFLSKIASEQEVPLSDLVELNELPNPSVIDVGQEIVVGIDEAPARRSPARPLAVPRAAEAETALLEQLPEWPIEMSHGESAMAFVAVFGGAAAVVLYAVYSGFSLAYEAVSVRMPPAPGKRRLWPRWARPRWPARLPGRGRRDGSDSSTGSPGRLAKGSRAAGRRAASAGARIWSLAGPASRRLALHARAAAAVGWNSLRRGVRRGGAFSLHAAFAAARGARPLGGRARGMYATASRERRQKKLRGELEEQAEVPLRLGLVEDAEARFRSSLAECEREGWKLEAALCLHGLANVAEAKGDRAEAVALQDRAIAAFREVGAEHYLFRAEMRRGALEEQ